MFDAKIYTERRKVLKSKFNSGLLLFLGNEESPMNYADNTFHYRQDSTFLYYWGQDYAGLNAIIDIDNDEEIIFGDELTIDYIIWMGVQPTIKEKAERAGVYKTLPYEKIKDYLNKTDPAKIHFLPQYRFDNQIRIFNWLNINPSQVNEKASVDFIKAVVAQREIKSAEEISELEIAASISADMHIAAMKYARAGMKEYEVAAKMTEVALAGGGNLSFPIICTINGQTLHNHYYGNTLSEDRMLLIDGGAESTMHYAGDLSHTFPISKKFTERQKEIYTVALNAHNAAVNKLAPGVRNLDVHLAACTAIASGLKELGFIKGNIEDAVKEGVHTLFFQCGTGHMMGLDVHDMENLGEQYVGYNDVLKKDKRFGFKSLRLGKELQPGFVLTVEPGIYFIPELIDLWYAEKKFADFINYEKVLEYKNFGGIRNEEDFLITETGVKMLGKDVPKTIEDIEEIRNY